MLRSLGEFRQIPLPRVSPPFCFSMPFPFKPIPQKTCSKPLLQAFAPSQHKLLQNFDPDCKIHGPCHACHQTYNIARVTSYSSSTSYIQSHAHKHGTELPRLRVPNKLHNNVKPSSIIGYWFRVAQQWGSVMGALSVMGVYTSANIIFSHRCRS